LLFRSGWMVGSFRMLEKSPLGLFLWIAVFRKLLRVKKIVFLALFLQQILIVVFSTKLVYLFSIL